MLYILKPKTTSKEITEKLESIFGNVATGENVLQEFYNATQKENESVTLWGIWLEEVSRGRGRKDIQVRNRGIEC